MQFNDVVLLVKSGVKVPALVLRSSVQPDGEYLALLYADPVSGPAAVGAGQYSSIGKVAFNVRPEREGSVNHWETLPASIPIVFSQDPATVPVPVPELSEEEIKKTIDEVLPPAPPEQPTPTEEEKAAHPELNPEVAAPSADDLPPAPEIKAENTVFVPGSTDHVTPSAADLDAVAAEQQAKEATTEEKPAEPVFETKHYADGSSATGLAPLPDKSPDEQKAAEEAKAAEIPDSVQNADKPENSPEAPAEPVAEEPKPEEPAAPQA